MNTMPEYGAIDFPTDVESTATAWDERWWTFQQINRDRRAVRDFDGNPIADDEIEALIGEALLAPSSENSQPYVIHWLRDPAMMAAGAAACRNQCAARSASTLLVFVAGTRFAFESISRFHAYVESTSELSEKSKRYHLREMKTRRRFLRIAPSFLWSPLLALLTTVFPSFALVPMGPSGVRHWAVRSALFAAQTILLAASARGLDTCPMEGYNPRTLGRILGLERGDVIALVVALGRRRPDALIEPRWRRPFEAALQVH
jgi:nitroreductase